MGRPDDWVTRDVDLAVGSDIARARNEELIGQLGPSSQVAPPSLERKTSD